MLILARNLILYRYHPVVNTISEEKIWTFFHIWAHSRKISIHSRL